EVEGVGGRQILDRLKAHRLLPPELLFTVSIVDRQGKVAASTRARPGTDVSDRDYFQLHRQSHVEGMHIGQPSRDEADGGELYFSRRLNGRGGAFAGVVAVSVSADYFVAGYEAQKLGEQGVLGVVGLDGVFRVRRSG